jgi:small-conductance mechanosensitive channel
VNIADLARRAATAAGFLAWLLFSGFALAQAATEAEAAFDLAPVTIDGRTLFQVRGVSSYPAEERAMVIADRIREAAADPTFEPGEVQVVESPEFSQIGAGQRVFMRLFNADAEVEQIDRHGLALVVVDRIRGAVTNYRAYRQPEYVTRSVVTVLFASVVLAVALFLLSLIKRRLGDFLTRRLKPRVVDVRVQSLQLVQGAQVWNTMAAAADGLRIIVMLIAIYVFVEFSLTQFAQTRAIGERLAAYLIGPLTTMGRGFVEQLPSLLFLVVLFFVVRIVLRLLQLYFAAIGSGTVKLVNFQPEWAVPTYRLVRVGIIAFALVVAYPYIPGSGSEAFKGLSIFFGVLLSIGSSSFVANSIAGYALIYRRLYSVGNRVQIGDLVGEVIEVRLQVTRLRTIKNEEVIIPNSTILGSAVVNFSSLSRQRGLILHTTVGIGYETPWRQVEGMLLMAAARTPSVSKEPSPFVLQKTLGDFCVTYELNAYTPSADGMAEKYHALHANILDVFNEYGVQIMTPAYEGDPTDPKVVPKERWYQEPSLPQTGNPPPARR